MVSQRYFSFGYIERRHFVKLDPDKFKADESRSNPAVMAFQYPDCPIGEICFYVATSVGSIAKTCEHMQAEGEEGECIYKAV
jgi:hypothetical protein